jgi:hypothetical protein
VTGAEAGDEAAERAAEREEADAARAAWGLPDDGPYRDGRVHVLDRMCDTCVFRRGNKMRLRPGRLAAMVREAISGGSAIVCHATLPVPRGRAVCRGFWRRHAAEVMALRLAQALKVVRFVRPPPGPF